MNTAGSWQISRGPIDTESGVLCEQEVVCCVSEVPTLPFVLEHELWLYFYAFMIPDIPRHCLSSRGPACAVIWLCFVQSSPKPAYGDQAVYVKEE